MTIDNAIVKKYECKVLKWDADYFEVSSARVDLNGLVDEMDQKKILEFAEKYDFVTIYNNNNMSENNYWITTKTNAFLVDMNMQFVKNLEYNQSYKCEKVYITNNLPRKEQIVNIAKSSFNYSRFFNDKKLPKSQAENIYLHWTECAFEQENKYFVIYEIEKNIVGYILFSIHNESSIIELIAVDEKYQQQQIGKSLIQTMEIFVLDKGISKIRVGTQINNILAIRFYGIMGFKYISCNSIYHLWKI